MNSVVNNSKARYLIKLPDLPQTVNANAPPRNVPWFKRPNLLYHNHFPYSTDSRHGGPKRSGGFARRGSLYFGLGDGARTLSSPRTSSSVQAVSPCPSGWSAL
jgi:hypothetical protein